MSIRAPRPCRLFLFDLDGTLIDSRTDIANSVNLSLARMNLRELPVNRVATFVGEGVSKLIQRSLGEVLGREPDQETIQLGTGIFFEEYGRHLLDTTRLYAGVEETLDRISYASLGIVTNKPESFSLRILEGLEILKRFQVILGGDSLPSRKPDPGPLLEAVRRIGTEPRYAVMVGDSPVDVAAGRAAGTVTCGMAGGYRGRQELAAAGCDLIVEGVSEIPDHFCPA